MYPKSSAISGGALCWSVQTEDVQAKKRRCCDMVASVLTSQDQADATPVVSLFSFILVLLIVRRGPKTASSGDWLLAEIRFSAVCLVEYKTCLDFGEEEMLHSFVNQEAFQL